MLTDKIYMLIDPRNNNPFYVGMTGNTLKQRLTSHCGRRKQTRFLYEIRINEIYNERLHLPKKERKPIIVLLENCVYPETYYWEGFWMEQLTAWGFNLLNFNKTFKAKSGWYYKQNKPKKLSAYYRLQKIKQIAA